MNKSALRGSARPSEIGNTIVSGVMSHEACKVVFKRVTNVQLHVIIAYCVSL